jgi:hypothetical protein
MVTTVYRDVPPHFARQSVPLCLQDLVFEHLAHWS